MQRSLRRADERGAGLVASLAGLLVVLTLLLGAVESLVGLYARSSMTASAHDAARQVASDEAVRAGDEPATRQAIDRADRSLRAQLGARRGIDAHTIWSIEQDQVVLRVQAPRPSFLPRVLGGRLPSTMDRTVRVRIEQLR